MKIFKHISILLSILLLAGCEAHIYREANANIYKSQHDVAVADQEANRPIPAVVVKSGYYVDTQPMSLKHTPRWMLRSVTLQANNIPMNILMDRLLRNSNVSAAYDRTVKPQQLVSMNYTGSVKGALNRLARQTNYNYTLHGDTLDWSAFETRTFNVSFMPGSSNYLVGRSISGGAANEATGTINGGVVNVGGLHDQQFSNMEGNLSIWRDIRHALNELKSPDGKVFVSESTTAVTVEDHPRNVHAMAQYIAKLNKALSQEVGIKVEVLEIQLNKQFNFGVDWGAVANTLDTTFKLFGNLASSVNPEMGNIIGNSKSSSVATFQIGPNEEDTMIKALGRQGKLRVVTKPQVVTLNNQIASIRITQDTGYVQSVSSSVFGSGENFVTTTIQPGTVTDGFTLYVLPKIQGNKVFMQISSTLSNLLRLQKISVNNNQVNNNNNNNNNQQFTAIEVPTIAEKAFNQRSVVKSGNTLIIAGFKRLRDSSDKSSLFGISPLGGKGAETQNIETLVFIKPTILHNTDYRS